MAGTYPLENNFRYHAPKEGQPALYEAMREQGKELAKFILDNTPQGREQASALTKVEEAIFWANAAIARNA